MLFCVLCILIVPQVLSEAPPAPPHNVRVHDWLLTWTPAAEDGDVTYTSQYSSFNSLKWTNVLHCVRTSLNSCNVHSTKAGSMHDCVKLRVQAERHGRTSTSVEACSEQGLLCTPGFNLTARSGSLIVPLTEENSLAQNYAHNSKYRVYYGKEGEPLQDYKDDVASVTINELQEGQRYCAKVQYLYYKHTVGMPSCAQCMLIPHSGSSHAEIIVPVLFLFVLFAFVMMAYLYIFQSGRVKRFLRPPCRIREDLLEPIPEDRLPIHSSPSSEEHFDVITSMTPV
ncbi:hypothetical protein PBY51_022973 [Eleginops maclovinus]|uniref:Fibronectin type-III domain-containing protein n=1 Tax=Eleginops maclovinus TaxID=56733 RepID=A0AAN7XGC6_ELEMC|nr:hypothetical protein PBY51_022973 [Eleginops maclovinus]